VDVIGVMDEWVLILLEDTSLLTSVKVIGHQELDILVSRGFSTSKISKNL
jgi:hypothetical protein